MKRLTFLLSTVAIIAATTTQAQFPVFPSADRVLGQPDFTSGATALTQSGMNFPAGVAVDPVSGKVFVSITGQSRILRFASSAAVANGADAEAVIGQTDYTTATSGTTATTLNVPYGIDVDRLGRLWVADLANNRVLMYEDAANLPEFGAAADLVLGQPNFVTSSIGTSQTKFSGPSGVFIDAADNLWVAEYGNHRVVKFANVSSLTNGAAAAVVLGQPDFVTSTIGTSSVNMKGPAAVLVDGANRLWVAEPDNSRVLRFDGATGLGNGAAANGVLGQPDFTTGTAGSTPVKMGQPSALAVDRYGALYIIDFNNSRVLYHKNPGSKANGATPDGVIGQPDLATVTTGLSAEKLNQPYGGLDFDAAGNLWISDYNNNRAIRFPGDFTTPAPTVTGKPPKTVQVGKLSLKGNATDPSGIAQVRYRVGKGPFKTALGTTTWKLAAKLKPGKNTIEIVAVDSFGNVSAAKKVKVKRQ
jgi:sugar lactone lactonase YvrE